MDQEGAVVLRPEQGLEDAVDLGVDGVVHGKSLAQPAGASWHTRPPSQGDGEAIETPMVADDLEPALDAAPVVVGQFQDEEVVEQVAVALGDGLGIKPSLLVHH